MAGISFLYDNLTAAATLWRFSPCMFLHVTALVEPCVARVHRRFAWSSYGVGMASATEVLCQSGPLVAGKRTAKGTKLNFGDRKEEETFMAYRIRRKKSVQKSVRKVAREQVDKAIGEVLDEELDRHETVHQVRKRCKKVRGLLRLVRPQFADYKRENQFFRDAAAELSYVRDIQAMIECHRELLDHFNDEIEREMFATIGDELLRRRRAISEDEETLSGKMDEFLARMREVRCRIEDWKIDDDGFSAIQDGLEKTYRRARKASVAAYEDLTAAEFHEWRKRVKYHWYHARLLRRIWPHMMHPHRDAADELADLLGDDHDLAVLRETLKDEPEEFGEPVVLQAALGLIDRRRAELESRARPLGSRLLAESPEQLADRWHAYWKVWKRSGKIEPEIADSLGTA